MSDMRAICGPNHKDRSGTFERATRRSGCDSGRSQTQHLLLQQVAVLRGHPGPTHAAATGVCELSHVHHSGNVGVAMTEEERDLVNALAGQ
jgi:hypothetical protein